MKSSAEIFRQNLRHEREKRQREQGNWSQENLAEKAGFHRNFIGMLERGERKPSLDALDRLADVLGVPSYELLKPREDSEAA